MVMNIIEFLRNLLFVLQRKVSTFQVMEPCLYDSELVVSFRATNVPFPSQLASAAFRAMTDMNIVRLAQPAI